MGTTTSDPKGPAKAEAPEKKAREGRSYRPLPALDSSVEQMEPFEVYFARHIDQVKRVQSILETKLSDNPAVFEDQFREAEAHYGSMTSVLAWADSYLDLSERRNLVPRHSDYTDVDREIHLAAACSRERRFRDVVKGLVRSLEQRVSVCQSIMKAYSNESRKGV